MISNQSLAMPAADPIPAAAFKEGAAIASPDLTDQNPTAEINAGGNKARKPAWNVPAAAGQEAATAGPIMGADTWPSLSSNQPARFSPKSTSTPSSSSDSLKSLSDGSAASASVIQKTAPSPESVLVQAAPPAQSKPHANPNPNPTRRENPNNRSSKWNNNNRRNYNNNSNNNYHHNNNNYNNGGFRGREKGGPNWNNNNNGNSWNNNGNNNSLHQRPQHFYRPNPAAPPPPPVSFGFTAPPVPPAFYSPMGFAEFPFPVIGHVPLIATAGAPQFIQQLVPPVILSTGEVERRNSILKQIEYYFSTENLCKDVYLRKNMDEQGWVPISLIAGFNRVKQLTTDMQYILDVIQGSSILEVQGDKIRARNNWMNWIFTERMQGLNITPPLTTGRNS